ncbi:MAG: ABC transporter permease [Candidatus Thorarchaeota archaeon]|nr:ABC transporter permease [Candidatus Thorarchaeota archaeon]
MGIGLQNRFSFGNVIGMKMKSIGVLFRKDILYLKKSARTPICLFMLVIPVIIGLNFAMESSSDMLTQYQVDMNFFWSPISYLAILIRLVTIIVASDAISSEFSYRTILTISAAPISRRNIFLSKFITALLYILFLEILVLIPYYLLLGSVLGLFPSLQALAAAFSITILMSFFGISLSLTISTISRNTVMSILIPFLYLYTGVQLLSMLQLDWFVYEYHYQAVETVLHSWIDSGILEFAVADALSLAWIIVTPSLLLLVSLIHFTKVDLRV